MLYGTVAGAGKSSIASIVVEHIRDQAGSQVAFLYLSYLESPSVKDLLGCLASQLIRPFGDSSSLPLYAKRLSRTKTSHPPGLKQLKQLLSELVSTSTFIVVDAMDEFDKQQSEELMGVLQKTKTNLFVTSRSLPPWGFEELDESLEVKAHDEDICHYIQERCKQNTRLIKMIKRDPSLEQDIKDAITSKAAGIFLLAFSHVEAILGLHTPSDVREALKELPSTRNSMYESTLKRIKAQDKTRSTHAMRTIGWIVYAFTPLKMRELRHALLIQEMNDSNNDQFHDSKVDIFLDHGALLQDTDILEFCLGLVEINKKTTAVRFSHLSALEYFTSTTVMNHEFPTFYSDIALACATYLCLTRLEESEIEGEADEYFDNDKSYREESIECGLLHEEMSSPDFAPHYFFGSSSRFRPTISRTIFFEQFPMYSNGSGVAKQLSFEMKCFLYPFATHAGAFLDVYFRATKEPSRSNVENQIRFLLESRPKRLCYSHFLGMMEQVRGLYPIVEFRSRDLPRQSLDLHQYGVGQVLGSELWNRASVDHESSALCYAAFIGSTKLFSYFYHQSCDTRDKNRVTGWALLVASNRGFLEMVRACIADGLMSDLTNPIIYSAIERAAYSTNGKLLSYLISTVRDTWESHKRSEDAASQNNGMGLFCKILDWIADKFNSFEDATDPDPSPATKEESLKLDGYLRLLLASAKGDAASILSLIKDPSISLNKSRNVGETDKTHETRTSIVNCCVGVCAVYGFFGAYSGHKEAGRVLTEYSKDGVSN